jgi:hypothetical protein
MKYPNNSTVKVGDLIWWDEGHCVGHVQVIAESKEDYESWGFDHPHIFVSNRHPFDPTLETGVAHDEACFEDEGIGPLTADEQHEFQRATKHAHYLAGIDPGACTYSVNTEVREGKFLAWLFTFEAGEQQKKITVQANKG